jgi:threonine-phosphate decarboxylase
MELLPRHGGQLRAIAERFQVRVGDLLDFSANVNPEGPPAGVLSALRAAVDDPAMLRDYPDLDEVDLRRALARYAGVRPENVAVSNGFVSLFETALLALGTQRCLVPVPCFNEYRRTLERLGRVMISGGDVGEACDAVLIANPQNPSGVVADLRAMLRAENRYVFLDEAFIDYCPAYSLASLVDQFPNLIVFRSVTKFFGMAGLRVAYAVAHERVVQRMAEFAAPWQVTSLASLAAQVAVGDDAYIRRTFEGNEERRRVLHDALVGLGIEVYPSSANFLLLRFPKPDQLWERLIVRHGIVLRNCANYEGLVGYHMRSAVRTTAENERLVRALASEI